MNPTKQKPVAAGEYVPRAFWEGKHREREESGVHLGMGISYVGGGGSEKEARALYSLRNLAMRRTFRRMEGGVRKVFELGSGGGYWAKYFLDSGRHDYYGADISKTTIERLQRSFPGGRFFCTENLSAWDSISGCGPFDLCMAFDVLYHITRDADWEQSMVQMGGLTQNGGYLLIVDYFHEQVRECGSANHVKHRSMQAYLDLLDKMNFTVQHVQPIFYFHNRMVGGPWQDQNRIFSRILRGCYASAPGISLLKWLDHVLTWVIRPMNPKSKARVLLARKLGNH